MGTSFKLEYAGIINERSFAGGGRVAGAGRRGRVRVRPGGRRAARRVPLLTARPGPDRPGLARPGTARCKVRVLTGAAA